MKILPITNNSYKAQNPSFNAVNQKYYDWGKMHIDNLKEIPPQLLYQIGDEVTLFKTVTPQDGIDTLKALRKKLEPKKDEWLNELIGEFKQLAKEERIKTRRALKKIKNP